MPFKIHTVLTDNAAHFTDPKGDGWTAAEVRRLIAEKATFRSHGFVLVSCAQNKVGHRLTKPKHPWSLRDLELIHWIKSPKNGHVECVNRAIKDAAVQRYYYESHAALRSHLKTFLDAHNVVKRLKTLKGLNPFEIITEKRMAKPGHFRLDPRHLIPRLNK